ncbi:hypothetical protein Hanom_Chr02g00176711 [Helianthus anomalus]
MTIISNGNCDNVQLTIHGIIVFQFKVITIYNQNHCNNPILEDNDRYHLTILSSLQPNYKPNKFENNISKTRLKQLLEFKRTY